MNIKFPSPKQVPTNMPSAAIAASHAEHEGMHKAVMHVTTFDAYGIGSVQAVITASIAEARALARKLNEIADQAERPAPAPAAEEKPAVQDAQGPLDFQSALGTWLAKAQELVNKGRPDFKLSVDSGGVKYVRIVESTASGSSRSAFAFINRENGDVLKPDSWKRPAKGARGNIYGDKLGVGIYGARALR